MNINDYIEKLRHKPEKEKERIAVIATTAAFLIVFGIWLISFAENNKPAPQEQSSSDVSNQLNDLKDNFGQGKQSIEDMMNSLPQDQNMGNVPSANSGADPNSGSNNSDVDQNASGNQSNMQQPSQNSDMPSGNNNQDNQNPPKNNLPSEGSIPQLP